MAPDWRSPTLDNGTTAPRGKLHIALVADTPEARTLLEQHVRVIKPPYWDGDIHLHVITNPGMTDDDVYILQAMVDLGWADSRDVQIGPPASLTDGYPSGTDE